MIRKVFAYVVRDGALLVFTDHHGELSVPKGTVEAGEELHDAVLRELHEESGIEGATIVRRIGERTVQVHGGPEMNGPLEEQHHTGFLIEVPGPPAERWSHIVRSDGIDNGYVYSYQWRAINDELRAELAYGADWFIREMDRIPV